MKSHMKELQKLKGIGAVLSQRLVESSYDTIAKVAAAEEKGLSRIAGMNPQKLRSIVTQARTITGEAEKSHHPGQRATATNRNLSKLQAWIFHVPVVTPVLWRAIMRIHVFIIYIVVSIGVLAGCSSIQPSTSAKITVASTLSLTACQKADSMWNDKIISTMYGDLPALTAPGVLDLFSLAKTGFTIRSLNNDSDELDVGHLKLVHAWGAEARFRFVSSKSTRGYTGIYESGSDCVIGRLSMATKPTKTTTVPGLALKFFISGHKSENLQIMNSTSGQKSHNFFEMPFSNIIPPPDSFAKRLMQKIFRKASVAYGAKDPDPTHLTVEHLAKIQVDGTAVVTPKSPFRLIFKPTAAASALMKDATVDTDFRTNLARYPVGQVMYDVYAMDEGESPDDLPANKLVGHLIPTSNIVASSYGDEKLNFQHNMEK